MNWFADLVKNKKDITQLKDDPNWENIKDTDIFAEDNTVEKAVDIAEYKVDQGNFDTSQGGRKDFVCYDCVRTIFTDAGIPMPTTSNVDTFMDAVKGYKVSLWNNGGPTKYDNNGDIVKERYYDYKNWEVLADYSQLQAGDIIVVKSRQGRGKHTALVTEVNGDPSVDNIIYSQRNGVTVVHDRGPGPNQLVESSAYSFSDLKRGQGGDLGVNRQFVAGFRYVNLKGD